MLQRRKSRSPAKKTQAAPAANEMVSRWEREMSTRPTNVPYKRRFGSFRAWELCQVIDWLNDTRVQAAGTTKDAVQLYAVFERPAEYPRATAARLRACTRANELPPAARARPCGLVMIPGLYERGELAALGYSSEQYQIEERSELPQGRRLFAVFARDRWGQVTPT